MNLLFGGRFLSSHAQLHKILRHAPILSQPHSYLKPTGSESHLGMFNSQLVRHNFIIFIFGEGGPTKNER